MRKAEQTVAHGGDAGVVDDLQRHGRADLPAVIERPNDRAVAAMESGAGVHKLDHAGGRQAGGAGG